MPYTDHAGLYGAVHESGLNETIKHIQRKRPSLFNYATDGVAQRADELLCRPIDAAQEVRSNGNRVVTPQDPVPVIGTNGLVRLEYGFQIPTVLIDFAPGDEIPFSEDTDLEVREQEFGVGVTVCAGLACPREEQLIELIDQVRELRGNPERMAEREGEPIVPTPRQLHCFCLNAFLVGYIEMEGPAVRTQTFSVDEIPRFRTRDIAVSVAADDELGTVETRQQSAGLPVGLRRNVECYLRLTVELGVLPRVAEAVANVVPRLLGMLEEAVDLGGRRAEVTTPTSGAVPANPSIEDDELRLHLDVTFGGANP